ncbi:NAD(P)/FAD-dependent oxidoreductase [Thiobaca trueperi]|uniref:Pyridine nucleotide-disulfide oxidoreductase n=1 Tax=Thiobaca trueperi TaxID=127458 RepID=A0A4R3MUN0_9GAMM|nr:pyridine nucleotide-disulfide oxidoreductase [Thiobaca trueperi]
MARILILGAGISGHTAARCLGRWVGRQHQVIVVSPKPTWNWVPSNIWVAVGEMTESEVTYELAPIYKKVNVDFRQASALSIHPEGDAEHTKPFVRIEYTDPARVGEAESIAYDFLINATGPRLNFAATPGLGPETGHTVSVCTPPHALEANRRLQAAIAAMKNGVRQTLLIGTGHGMATCQGAAFEYICNVDHVLREAGVRQQARLIWLSNEYEVGDLGIGGVLITRGGYVTSGKVFVESLYLRTAVIWQFIRFWVIGYRVLKLMWKPHG